MGEPECGALTEGPSDALTLSRVLILGCSRRQIADPAPVPALVRYDGPSFRVLRRFLGEATPATCGLTVLVLSAEHGLIPADELIVPYNRPMTIDRAHELAPLVRGQMAASVMQRGGINLLIGCSRGYVPALGEVATLAPAGSRVRIAPFRPGERLACLHDWLYGRPPLPAQVAASYAGRPATQTVSVRLRGVEVTFSGQELLAHAGRALAGQSVAASAAAPSRWAVDLDGRPVSPKWLVSIGFGLRPSAFGTSDALRVLAALGISVQRRPG